MERRYHTEHVAILVLAGLLAGNVTLDAKPDHGGVLHRVLGNVEATNDAEAATIVDILSQALELGTKGWEREVVRANVAAVQFQS